MCINFLLFGLTGRYLVVGNCRLRWVLPCFKMIILVTNVTILELFQSPILCCTSPIVYEVLPWHSKGKASSSKLRDDYMGHCHHCRPYLMVVCQTLSSFSYNPGSVCKENLRSVRKKRVLPHQFVVRCIGGKYETIGNGLVVADQALLVKESLLSYFCPSSSNKQKHFYNFPANFSSGNTRAGANLLSLRRLLCAKSTARGKDENGDNVIRVSSKTPLFWLIQFFVFLCIRNSSID